MGNILIIIALIIGGSGLGAIHHAREGMEPVTKITGHDWAMISTWKGPGVWAHSTNQPAISPGRLVDSRLQNTHRLNAMTADRTSSLRGQHCPSRRGDRAPVCSRHRLRDMNLVRLGTMSGAWTRRP